MAICKSNHPPHQSWIQKIILLQAKTNFEKHLKKEKIPFDILSALLELDESKLNVFWFPPLLKLHSFQIREEITKKRNCRGKVIWTMPKIICFQVISSIRLDNSRHIIGSHLNNSTILFVVVVIFYMHDSIVETLVLRLSQQVSGTKANFQTNLRKSIKF